MSGELFEAMVIPRLVRMCFLMVSGHICSTVGNNDTHKMYSLPSQSSPCPDSVGRNGHRTSHLPSNPASPCSFSSFSPTTHDSFES